MPSRKAGAGGEPPGEEVGRGLREGKILGVEITLEGAFGGGGPCNAGRPTSRVWDGCFQIGLAVWCAYVWRVFGVVVAGKCQTASSGGGAAL